MQNNSTLTEIALLVISVALVAAATVLLVAHIIDFSESIWLFGLVAGLFGVNGALKAPSPSQQAQLNVQQQNVQQLFAQALSVLPGLVQQAQATQQRQAVQAPAPVQQPAQVVQQPFRQNVQIPDFSMPMAAMGTLPPTQ
jgi:hypothetical protein